MAKRNRQLDLYYWKACAGISARVPAVGAAVYYFPDGHTEEASSPPDLSAVCRREPFLFPCFVASVQLLADQNTDEVYAVICLVPSAPQPPPVEEEEEDLPLGVAGVGVQWTAKVLTPSDANNGGGFSVPRQCADDLLPELDRKAKPPVQMLSFTDAHGKVWEFRHIYRGKPERHLLTTGWSRFVNSKRLVAGDSVVFVRNSQAELFVGLRRAVGASRKKRGRNFYARYGAGTVAREGESHGGCSRTSRGKVPPEAVTEAVAAAEKGNAFEVVYYPREGANNFVVGRAMVDKAVSFQWKAGMRVRVALEIEDKVKVGWHQGTVIGMKGREQCPWSWSPWRMLQVQWDDPELLGPSVNPWEVELLVDSPVMASPPVKMLRRPYAELKDIKRPFTTCRMNSTCRMNCGSGCGNPSSVWYNSFPAGMQGARQDRTGLSSLSLFTAPRINSAASGSFNPSSIGCSSLLNGIQGARQELNGLSNLSSFRPYITRYDGTVDPTEAEVSPTMDYVSTELSIGTPTSSETTLTAIENILPCSTPICSFQLFGKAIQITSLAGWDTSWSNAEGQAGFSGVSLPCQEDQPSEVHGQEAVDSEARST